MGARGKDAEGSTVILPMHRDKEPAVRILECAEAVHGALGAGLESLFYARALAIQLHACGLEFQRDCWIELRYGGVSLGRRRIAFLLETIAVEVLSSERIGSLDVLRTSAIVAASQRAAGLLLNFGGVPLEVKRVDVPPCTG